MATGSQQMTRWETAQDGLDKLSKSNCPVPIPGEDEVLVEIRAVSLNYRDTEVAMGLYTHHKAIGASPKVVPCSDMCGIVVGVGSSKRDGWNVGDRVLSIFNQTHLTGQIKEKHMPYGLGLPLDGVLQQYRVFPVTGLVKAPDYLTDEEASTLPIAALTAWMSINGMRPINHPGGQGETVLLQGTGGVSISGLQIAHAAGAKTIVTSSSDAKLTRAEALGATFTINYRKDPDWQNTVMKLTENEGVDIIFENGGAQTLRKSFDCISFGGLINCIGYLSGKQDEPADRTNTNVLALRRNVTLKGILNGPKDRFEEMMRFYEAKKIKPVVDKVFPFDEAKEAFKHLTEVEERLEKAEALLKTFFTEAELSQMLVHGIANNVEIPSRTAGHPTTETSSQATASGFSQTPVAAQGSAPRQQERTRSFSAIGAEPDQKVDLSHLESPGDSKTEVADDTTFALDNPPAGDEDFAWDERESSWNIADPGTGGSAFGGNVDSEIPKITDGMATLTADDSNAGFLGSVSGSALLRLIWMSTGTDNKANPKAERRESLEQLFSHRSTEYPATATPWLRAQPLFTRAVVDSLIDAYFALYHPTFPILHEVTFREQYAKLNSRTTSSTWHTLANLVAALGSFVSSTCSDDTHVTLFNGVKANLSINSLETGSISLVQAFAMAANYLQKRNRPNSGYNYGGIALRLAISLGLHKEFRGWQTAPFKKEIRRRVWWSLCVLDVGATVTYGRPLNWPQVGVDIPFPLNIHEKDLQMDCTSYPPEVNEPTIYTYVRTQSSYHLHTIRIYNRLISNPIPSAAELISLDDELIEGWLSSLPPYFRDNHLALPNEYLLGHAISRWRFRIMRIIMYRPFLIRWAQDGLDSATVAPKSPAQNAPAETIATNRCFKAAEECISAIFDFWSSGTHTRLAAWYVLYFLLQAALIPIHCLRRNPNHADASSWRNQILTALSIINAMNDLNPSAPKCRDIIHRLCGESLDYKPLTQSQQSRPQPQMQTQQDTAGSWTPFANTDSSFSTPPFPFSNPDSTDTGMNPWMTEIDTAIDGYDIYCDRLSHAAMAGMGRLGSAGEAGLPGGFASTDGTQIGTGVQDWDWTLML
ncbi:hypothetical protein AYL99_10341 [Fonsecaea erecta]|uniref:Transcription factor domain-containing protein n=1 Tax=Fonsecaea erecta TaxID=1367422 RepID=A0A178Z6H1_9EURO|nr:hypothetical protein AYL99_10341 [Fonsecaea erecta]OAP55368.1 hypothetical protein AYL99_10341 [Fonsecaea erecta]